MHFYVTRRFGVAECINFYVSQRFGAGEYMHFYLSRRFGGAGCMHFHVPWRFGGSSARPDNLSKAANQKSRPTSPPVHQSTRKHIWKTSANQSTRQTIQPSNQPDNQPTSQLEKHRFLLLGGGLPYIACTFPKCPVLIPPQTDSYESCAAFKDIGKIVRPNLH